MSEPEPSFETRLESMERRLAEIQRELAPEPQESPEPDPRPPAEPIPLRPHAVAPPAPPAPEPEPEPRAPAGDPADIELLGTLYGDLLGSVRRLLDGYEGALGRLSHRAAPQRGSVAAEVVAGPFRETAAVREFERALARLPGVREVTLRGYQSGNRAILEVQLEPQTS